MRLSDGLILWCVGGLPSRIHDKALFDFYHIFSEIPDDEIILGDSGYQGAEKVLTPFKKPRGGTLTPEQKEVNNYIHSRRVKVENTFAHMKQFSILSQDWRQDLNKQRLCFNILAHCRNIEVRTSSEK